MSARHRFGGKLVVLAAALWLCACSSAQEAQPEVSARPPLTPSSTIHIARQPALVAKQNSEPVVSSPTAAATEPTQTPAQTSTPTQSEPTPEPTTPAFIQYAIQPGDTLLGIALEFGVSMASIQLANGMGSAVGLMAGQTLSVPGSTQWLDEGHFWAVHVVQSGETLVGVASAYDLAVDDILRVNAVADPDMIHINQQLVIPLTRLVTLARQQPTVTAPAIAVAAATDAPKPTLPNQSGTASEVVTETEAIAAPEAAPPPTAVPVPAQPAGQADWSGYILARINQVRAEHGLNMLNVAPELTLAAQAHAQDCATRGWGSHVGSDGAVLKTRLDRAGYTGPNRGENWVQARNAERAFDWWYGEIPPNDPHRRNILSPHYAEIGIGIAQTDSGYIFVTDFGHR